MQGTTVLVVFTTLCLNVLSSRSSEQKCCPSGHCYELGGAFAHLPAPECGFDIQYLLCTRSVNNTPITHQRISDKFKPTRRTIFVVHGFRDNITKPWLHDMKNEFLKKDDLNVVLVIWAEGAKASLSINIYNKPAANTRVVGADIADMTRRLQAEGLARSDTWCVGFSLGAHACGFAGKLNRWGRITGLDPAGLNFEGYSPEARLHQTDGDYVDVIHTSGKGGFLGKFSLGLMVPVGHADFYPNGARRQNGCQIPGTYRRDTDVLSHYRHRRGIQVSCSHRRSYQYYIESINNNCFDVSINCSSLSNMPHFCSDCGEGCQLMGYGSKRTAHGLFYLTTDAKSPYCKPTHPFPEGVLSTAATGRSAQITAWVVFFSTLINNMLNFHFVFIVNTNNVL